MGNSPSKSNKHQRVSMRPSNDVATKNKTTHKKLSFEDDEPPAYDYHTPTSLGPRHTRRVSTVPPERVPTSVDRYKDPNYLRQPLRKESRENALETLKKYDTVLIMDDSGSMLGNRWEEAKKALSGLASVAAEYDENGLDIHFLNHSDPALNLKSSSAVNALFENVHPKGYTPIGDKLEALLSDYLQNLESAQRERDSGNIHALKQIKPVNFIVITDGIPTDDPESVIVAAARRLDSGNFPLTQVGIQFVQIGSEKSATKYLRELDDTLSNIHRIRDIVDTTPYLNMGLTSEMLVKILIGGINRRVDRRGGEAVSNI